MCNIGDLTWVETADGQRVWGKILDSSFDVGETVTVELEVVGGGEYGGSPYLLRAVGLTSLELICSAPDLRVLAMREEALCR